MRGVVSRSGSDNAGTGDSNRDSGDNCHRVTTQDVPCYRVPTLTPVPTSLSDDPPTLCLKRDCEHGYQSCQDSDVRLAGMTDHLQ